MIDAGCAGAAARDARHGSRIRGRPSCSAAGESDAISWRHDRSATIDKNMRLESQRNKAVVYYVL